MKSSENQNNKIFNIFIFTPTLDGGVGRVVTNLANGLVNFNFKVTLLVPNTEGNFYNNISPEIVVHSFNKKRVSSCLFELTRILKQSKPDVVLSLSFHANCIVLMAHMFAGANRTVCIISEHINLSQALNSVNFIQRFILRSFIYIFYPKADGFVAVSHGAADSMAKYAHIDRSKVHVIYNPVVDENFSKLSLESVTHPFFINKQIPVIITVGRLDRQKDIPTLLRAFAQVRKENKVKLIICGDGPLREMLEHQTKNLGISEDVDFVGFVDNPLAYMKQSDVFVLSSIYEGLPTVLIEALALRMHIVSTDCKDGPKEILNNGEYGMLVPVGNPESLADAITDVFKNPRSTELEPSYLAQYTIPFAVEKYATLIKSLLISE